MNFTDNGYRYDFSGHPVTYSFLYPNTYRYFDRSFKKTLIESNHAHIDIRMPDDHFRQCSEILGKGFDNSYIEFKGLATLTSQFLLRESMCILHAVSFVYNGKAWLLAAPSGTGKSTQFLNWNSMYPGEIQMISGDHPFLEKKMDSILVHPSPWNGKERLGNQISAELAGIILLQQGTENCINPINVHEAIVPVFSQFRTILDTEEEIIMLCSITDCIFRNYPIWVFINDGSRESTDLLREHIRCISALKGDI